MRLPIHQVRKLADLGLEDRQGAITGIVSLKCASSSAVAEDERRHRALFP
jgi:hypothetical protein